jgi:aldehyde:ferredoxin oxidoreductase
MLSKNISFRINMFSKEIDELQLSEEYNLLGGRSLIAKILLDEVKPTCNALGPNNKLIFAPGLLGGTIAPCSGRLSIGGKSPLTGGIKESNVGGIAATKLSKLNIKALIIEDKPQEDKWYIIHISTKGVEILEEAEIIGADNYFVSEYLLKKYGNKVAIISIGSAGEKQYRSSAISVTDMEGLPTRHAARGGLGALMGSKRIKAIVIDDTGAKNTLIADSSAYKEISKKWITELVATKKVLTTKGTANLVTPMNELGCLPTHNFREGNFASADAIDAESLQKTIKERNGKQGIPCHPGCVIRCGKTYNDAKGNYITSGMEYETIVLMGSNCGIDDLDTIAKMNRICDEIGIDTMEIGVTIGVIMESGMIAFGDKEGAINILEEIKKGTVFGKLAAQGAEITGKALGVSRIPTVKSQGISGYDPRGLKGTGVTYITSPQGADHTAGNALPGRVGYRHETEEVLDVQKPEGQVALSRDLQIMTAVCDLTGLCFFVGTTKSNMEIIAQLLNAKFGINVNIDNVVKLGQDCIHYEKEFNSMAGFNEAHDQLPEFFYLEKLPPKEVEFDISEKEIRKTLKF